MYILIKFLFFILDIFIFFDMLYDNDCDLLLLLNIFTIGLLFKSILIDFGIIGGPLL